MKGSAASDYHRAVDPLRALGARLPDGSLTTHPGEMAARASDAWSLALLRARRGEPVVPPRALVFARSTEDVAEVLAWSDETDTPVVTRGGGSGVAGGALARRGAILLDLSEMDRVLSVDPDSQAVEVQAGVRGDRLEEALEPHGLTTGHYPQSLTVSTVGGWIAARSAGQASAGYGAIEDLLLGLTVVLPGGAVLRLRATPRSAAGPDLRRLFAGSEGPWGSSPRPSCPWPGGRPTCGGRPSARPPSRRPPPWPGRWSSDAWGRSSSAPTTRPTPPSPSAPSATRGARS